MPDHTMEICVIGLGRRGLSVLERLCANAAAQPDRPTVLHVVDTHLGRGGRSWRTDQSDELLMNTVASRLTMFVDESVDPTGLRGPNLYEWAQFDALVGERECTLGRNDFPSRACYGQYLTWVLHHLIDNAPDNVTIVLYRQQAVDLTEQPDGSQTVTLACGATIRGLDGVVLAVGHTATGPAPEESALLRHAERQSVGYVPPALPSDVDTDAIAPGEVTVLRGMGRTFFDHLTLLTVGRGGRFERTENGTLRYHASGVEPRLIAGSRSGVPQHALRGHEQDRREPMCHNDIARLLDRAEAGEPINFLRDVWPVVDREVRCVYYGTLIAQRCDAAAAADFRREFLAHGAETALLTRFGVGPDERWSWQRIARPYGDRRFADRSEFRTWLLSYLSDDIRHGDAPLTAALDVLRDLRDEIRLVIDRLVIDRLVIDRLVIDHGTRDDLRRWYGPLDALVAVGPPVGCVERLVALIEAGVVDVLGPQLRVVPTDGGYWVDSVAVPDTKRKATALVECRCPDVDLRRTADPLLSTLLDRGDLAPQRIPLRDGGTYDTGGLAVTTGPQHVLDGDHRPHPRRFAFGLPTEIGWPCGTGLFAAADAIARNSLRIAGNDRTADRTAALS